MIESFQAKHIREVSCGTGHSAAVSVNGELFTWGQGDDGRLGHGDTNNQTKPKLVHYTCTCTCTNISITEGERL